MKLKLIVAMCKGNGIGFGNNIPWKIKKDLLYFSNKTTGEYGKRIKDIQKGTVSTCEVYTKNIKKNAIIMGKKTWLSLPKYPEPLKNRDNIILSSSTPESITYSSEYDFDYDLIVHLSSISRVMDFCMLPSSILGYESEIYDLFKKHEMNENREINQKSIIQNNNSTYDEIWIIGGEQIYNTFVTESLNTNTNMLINDFYITYIDKHYKCDTFFPSIENMNLYYISSFSRCDSIDENIGLRVPVYYIVFSIIDYDSKKNIQKKYVENHEKSKYYYYYSSDDCICDYITNDNMDSFMWCIIAC